MLPHQNAVHTANTRTRICDPLLLNVPKPTAATRIIPPERGPAVWRVTRFADVALVTSDPRFRRVPVQDAGGSACDWGRLARSPAFLAADERGRLRALLDRELARRNTAHLRVRAEQHVVELVERMCRAGGPGDLISRVLSPFPARLLGELVGVDLGDLPRMIEWAQRLMTVPVGGHDSTVSSTAAADRLAKERAAQAHTEAREHFHALAARRRARPGGDLLTTLVTGCDRGELGDEEVVRLAMLVQFNGWFWVRNSTASMVYLLITRPHLLDQLRGEPALVPDAVEELLRCVPHESDLGTPWIAAENVRVGDVLIPAGDLVHVSYSAANLDESAFPHADAIDFRRGRAPHVTFGSGANRCVAAGLVRLHARVVLEVLLERIPGMRLAVPADRLPWQANTPVRGPLELPVHW